MLRDGPHRLCQLGHPGIELGAAAPAGAGDEQDSARSSQNLAWCRREVLPELSKVLQPLQAQESGAGAQTASIPRPVPPPQCRSKRRASSRDSACSPQWLLAAPENSDS